MLASDYEQLGAHNAVLSSRAIEAERRAAEERVAAAEERVAAAADRAVAAADRDGAARDRDKHAGMVELLRARLKAREHDWSTS